jgi:hypothetical protein
MRTKPSLSASPASARSRARPARPSIVPRARVASSRRGTTPSWSASLTIDASCLRASSGRPAAAVTFARASGGEGQGDGDDGDDGDDGGGTSFAGMITLDEYDWFGVEAYLGVIQIDLDTLEKRRFLEGRMPWRHPDGTTFFLQGCGDLVSRVAMADAEGLVRVGTPCSDDIENPGYGSTNFGVSRLSPDETMIAVEAYYYLDSGYVNLTAVYEVAGERLAIFDDLWAPTWTPDGKLLLTGDGFHLVERDLSSPRRIDGGQLVGPLNNPPSTRPVSAWCSNTTSRYGR